MRYLIEEAELCKEDSTNRKKGENDDDRRNEWDKDMAYDLSTGGPVQGCCLGIAWIYSGKCSNIDNAGVTCISPEIYEYKYERLIDRFDIPVHSLDTGEREYLPIEESKISGEKCEEKGTDHNLGKEIGKKHHPLIESCSLFRFHPIEGEGYCNRDYSSQYNEGKVIQDGVPGNDPGIRGTGKEFEILHADPFASQYSLRVVDILKGNDYACHGEIVEQKQDNCSRNEHGKAFPISLPATLQTILLLVLHYLFICWLDSSYN